MKKIISWVLSATLVLTTAFAFPVKAEAATVADCTEAVYYVDTFEELKAAFETNGSNRTIILEENIDCTDSPSTNYMITKTGSDTVVLDFKGKQLRFKTTNTESIFKLTGSGSVFFVNTTDSEAGGIFLDFGKNASIGEFEPSIVYVNVGTANGFYSYDVNYYIGNWDTSYSEVIQANVYCTNIRIKQGDVTISDGVVWNYYNMGNGIGGIAPRSFDVVLDEVRISSGHSPIYFINMDEIDLSIYNAELKSFEGHICIWDTGNSDRKLTYVLGEDHVNGGIPSVTFSNSSLNVNTAKLTDVKNYAIFSMSVSGQSYHKDSIIFPTGHLELRYETNGLGCIVPHTITKKIVKATPQADGSIIETCPCGMVMSTPIPSFSDIKIQYTQSSYGGNPQTPYVYYVKDREGKELTRDVDYTVSYKNNVNVGTATVTITGKGDYYTGSFDKNYEITHGTIEPAVVSDIPDQTYTGSAITPEPVLKLGEKVLVKDTDYTVTYENNVNAGTATVKITGTGNYIGTKQINFKIIKPAVPEPEQPAEPEKPTEPQQPTEPEKPTEPEQPTEPEKPTEPQQPTEPEKVAITAAKITGITAKTYTGSAISPMVTVTVNGKVLTEGKDYSVTYSDNVNAGTGMVKVAGIGDYTGEKVVEFAINPKKITTMSLAKSAYAYDGKIKKPAVTVKAGSKVVGQKISADTASVDVTYAKGRKNVGKYKVTVTGTGNYTGTLSKTFKINPKATSIKSLTKGKKALTAKWTKRTTQVTGYEVCVATNKNFTKGKKTLKVKNYKTNLKKVTGLKSGQKYWVKVRTYKTINGTKFYSTWSTAKSVKVK